MTFTRITAILALALAAGAGQAQDADDDVTVVTALQPTYSLTSALTEGTGIEVVNVPGEPAAMAALGRALERAEEEVAPVLERADAVVTLRSVWPEDPLFSAARAANIRIVEIDAAIPVGGERAGVGLLPAPVRNVPWREAPQEASPAISPYVWLSISNAQRMAEIVATDLTRLAPEAADRIAENLTAFKNDLRQLKTEYDLKFLELPEVAVFSLSDRFPYLLSDMGLYATGHFLEQDLLWTEADHAGFTRMLSEVGPDVVIHHWEPAESIQADIDAGGATLAVLDSGDPAEPGLMDADGYEALISGNLETLFQTLSDQGE